MGANKLVDRAGIDGENCRVSIVIDIISNKQNRI